ncbi:hypothetical protein FY528_11500 [Hymenobacter lutimineralis]|uniref:STAS/SEC14 domain-containing protein n=1 Tax=Hymenobacter lutimineralis TaxID=2606448 RepID=A0A5D6UZJ8_9BACT|nr:MULTISPECIES: hypothetical protein [Hymenobacter]QIX61460.1 hypothetical protein HER32_09830 [Hymenobacter sp. BT18]TYZ08836.1 hypothetical protein FY528_11500 [Hymenobacter lutimineralis]
MTPFTEEESQWIVEYWLSEESRGQRIYAAVLLDPAAFASIPAQVASQEATAAALTYRLFDQTDDAEAWLLQRFRS